MARSATSWKPGQTGNPNGRPGISLPELVRKLAIERKADKKIAEAVLSGVLTGIVPLQPRSPRPEEILIGKDGPLEVDESPPTAYSLNAQEWMKLLGYVYPGEKEPSRLPDMDEEAEEVARAGVKAALEEAQRRGIA